MRPIILALAIFVLPRAGLAAEADTPQIGPWHIIETRSPIDDSRQIFAMNPRADARAARNEPVSLSVRCRERQLGFYVNTEGVWGGLGGASLKVTYRVDQQPAVTEQWPSAADGKAVYKPGRKLAEFLRSLPDKDGRFFIRVFDYIGASYDASFDLGDFAGVRSLVADTCKDGAQTAVRRKQAR